MGIFNGLIHLEQPPALLTAAWRVHRGRDVHLGLHGDLRNLQLMPTTGTLALLARQVVASAKLFPAITCDDDGHGRLPKTSPNERNSFY